MTSTPTERQDLIAERLGQGQPVNAGALAEEFAVSLDAIRRDLRVLAAQGRCRRIYGGALPLSPASQPIAVRIEEKPEQKVALAKAAAALIQPEEFLFLDNGSTNLALAHLLPDMGLTVATNSIVIAAALANRLDLSLHVVGGAVDATVGGCIDGSAVLTIQQMNIDRCFLGACSLSAVEGASAFYSADAAFKRVLLTRSRHVALMVTNEKLGTRAPYQVSPPDCIDSLIVEHDAASCSDFPALAQLGINIVTAALPL